MQATLDASSLKTFTKAAVCLSKYGDELTVHATPDFFSLSATNSSKSAYSRFKWDKQFFSRYNFSNKQQVANDWGEERQDSASITGQLLAKGLLSILKHRTVEKSVDRCELSIIEGNDQDGEEEDSLESKLILKLHCKHGIVKTHRLLLMALTTLLAPGVPEATNESRLSIGPKALKDLIDHFPVAKSARSDPQLVWTFDETEVGLKSVESSIDSRGRGQLSTELTISSEEFDLYEIDAFPITIAFHLREFTATIAFADSIAQSLDLKFTDPAAPLFIDLEGDDFDTLFVISTSQVPGAGSNGTQKTPTQTVNNKKRERSHSETPRLKRPMKVVQPADPEAYNNPSRPASRAPSHLPGSMPPPSIIPNRPMLHPAASQSANMDPQGPFSPPQHEPLFLPTSSQMSAADLDALRATGLGIEDMNAEELADMLEGDGQEVDFSQRRQCQQPPGDNMQVDEPESLELVDDTTFPATQSSQNIDKSFQPLFED